MKEEEFKGKYYELINIDGSIITRIKINFVRKVIEPEVTHEDRSFTPTSTYIEVSNNGSGWYRYNGNMFERIVEKVNKTGEKNE